MQQRRTTGGRTAFECFVYRPKSNGAYLVGHCYHYGRGVDKDEAEAVRFYSLAADQGLALAQSNLGEYQVSVLAL
jgi:TPR repeat protein